MMIRICACFLATLLCAAAFGQTTENAAKFEIADVHSSPYYSFSAVRGPFFSTSRYELRDATMLDLIRIAYGVDPEKVAGGPSWLEMDRFDVFARTPETSTAESRKRMLQALLAERFALAIHNDNKPMAAYALTAGKHGGLKESDGAGEQASQFNVE